MNNIGKVVSMAILTGALTAMSPGPLWAQASDSAPTSDSAPAKDALPEHTPPAELIVQNNNWLDAHVYLVRGGVRTSLGFMTALQKRAFDLPSWATLPDVQILVHLIGGSSYLTPAVEAYPGDVVKLVLQNNLALSSTVVFPAG